MGLQVLCALKDFNFSGSYLGIDSDSKMINNANRFFTANKYKNYTFKRCNIKNLKIEKKFDLILVWGVVGFFENYRTFLDKIKKLLNKKFQVITLNKVLEHVKSPNLFLNKIRKLLEKKGFIYIEVPDGIAAKNSLEGKNREEFYLDHLHVFSVKSLTNCLTKSKFNLLEINRIKEKSGKYTIYAFAQTI